MITGISFKRFDRRVIPKKHNATAAVAADAPGIQDSDAVNIPNEKGKDASLKLKPLNKTTTLQQGGTTATHNVQHTAGLAMISPPSPLNFLSNESIKHTILYVGPSSKMSHIKSIFASLPYAFIEAGNIGYALDMIKR
jgi:hypothetical protein